MTVKIRPQHIIILILLIVAVGLGVAIYKPASQKTPEGKPTSTTPPQTSSTKVGSPSARLRPLTPDLTAEEKSLFNLPSPDAPNFEKDKHLELALKMAKQADNLDIKDCNSKPDPLVMKVEPDTDIKVKNSSNKDHKISLNKDNSFTIPKNSTVTIKPQFAYPIGVFGYICDDTPGIVGFFAIPPNK